MNKRNYMYFSMVVSLFLIVLAFVVLVAAPTQTVSASVNQQDIAETCKGCHPGQATPWSGSKHSTGNVNCLVCHKLSQGEGVHPQLKYTVESEDTTCLVCHTEVAGTNIADQMKLSQHGKVGLKCITCHEPHSQGPVLSPGSKIVCENCHKKQMEGSLKSTHTAAGLNCINCHMGPERSHTLKVAGQTCGECHTDIHEANRIVSAGLAVEVMGTPMASNEATPAPTEQVANQPPGGIHLPTWTLILAGLLVGGVGSWAVFGRDPGTPTE